MFSALNILEIVTLFEFCNIKYRGTVQHNFPFDRRAKEKRLKKDAGRARWGQYFRGLKPNSSSPIHGGDKPDSDRESELDYNQCESLCSSPLTKDPFTIDQNLPNSFLKVLFGLLGRSRGPRGQRPLIRELRHKIGFG